MNPRRALYSSVAALAILSAARAVVIGFDNMGGVNGDIYTGHTESGFTITPVGGIWYKGFLVGNPRPCLGDGPTNVDHIVQVTRTGGGLFTCQSFDKRSMQLATWCDFDGYREGRKVYHYADWVFQGGFRTVLNGRQDQIDELYLTIEPTTGGENLYLDTIIVTPVPEPEMLTALAVGLVIARRRKAATPKSP